MVPIPTRPSVELCDTIVKGVFVNGGLTTDNCTLNEGLEFDEPVRISLKIKLPKHPSFTPAVYGRSNLSVVGLSSL